MEVRIVKPDSMLVADESKYIGVVQYYKESDTEEIDLDEELSLFNSRCVRKCPDRIGDCKNCKLNHQSFSEYLKDKLNG